MRWWSEQLGIFVEGVSLWNGRDSLTEGVGWIQRSSALMDAAPGRESYPSQKEVAQANLVPADAHVWQPALGTRQRCSCGRVRAKKARKCTQCQQKAKARREAA